MKNISLEYPQAGREDKQMEAIVLFMVKHHQIIFEPLLFCRAWHSGKMKIFTLKNNDEIEALYIVGLITDPVTGLIHKIKHFAAGVDIEKEVNEVLSVYSNSSTS